MKIELDKNFIQLEHEFNKKIYDDLIEKNGKKLSDTQINNIINGFNERLEHLYGQIEEKLIDLIDEISREKDPNVTDAQLAEARKEYIDASRALIKNTDLIMKMVDLSFSQVGFFIDTFFAYYRSKEEDQLGALKGDLDILSNNGKSCFNTLTIILDLVSLPDEILSQITDLSKRSNADLNIVLDSMKVCYQNISDTRKAFEEDCLQLTKDPMLFNPITMIVEFPNKNELLKEIENKSVAELFQKNKEEIYKDLPSLNKKYFVLAVTPEEKKKNLSTIIKIAKEDLEYTKYDFMKQQRFFKAKYIISNYIFIKNVSDNIKDVSYKYLLSDYLYEVIENNKDFFPCDEVEICSDGDFNKEQTEILLDNFYAFFAVVSEKSNREKFNNYYLLSAEKLTINLNEGGELEVVPRTSAATEIALPAGTLYKEGAIEDILAGIFMPGWKIYTTTKDLFDDLNKQENKHKTVEFFVDRRKEQGGVNIGDVIRRWVGDKNNLQSIKKATDEYTDSFPGHVLYYRVSAVSKGA